MSKNMKQALAILIAIFVVFSVIVLAIPFAKGGAFWISYIAEIIAIALQIPVFKLAFDNRDELKSKVLGFPIFRIGYIYLGAQTAVSLITIIIGTVISGFPVWIPAVLDVIILGGAFVCSMAADIARDEVERIEYATQKDTTLMMKLRTETAALEAMTDDTTLKAKLKKLAEDVRFSDPVSGDATYNDENALADKISELSASLMNGKGDAAALCEQASKMLSVRNVKCKAGK